MPLFFICLVYFVVVLVSSSKFSERSFRSSRQDTLYICVEVSLILFERFKCVIYTYADGLYGLSRINSEILYFRKKRKAVYKSDCEKCHKHLVVLQVVTPQKKKWKKKMLSCLCFYFSLNTVIKEEAAKINALLVHNEPIFDNDKAF